MSHPSPDACATCPAHNAANLVKLGVDMESYDYVVALAGNPNTGKSTVFSYLTKPLIKTVSESFTDR